MSKMTLTKNETPSSLLSLFYMGFSLGMGFAGYAIGCQYELKHYKMQGPMEYLDGGYPFAIAFYNLSLQACVDFNRTPWAKKLDKQAKSLTNRISKIFFKEKQPTSLVITEWNKSCIDILKLILLRVADYGAAGVAGGAAILAPINLSFSGGDVYQASTQEACLVFALGCGLIGTGLYFNALRSNQLSITTVDDEHASNQMLLI